MLGIQAVTGRFLFLKSKNPKWFCGPELASDQPHPRHHTQGPIHDGYYCSVRSHSKL